MFTRALQAIEALDSRRSRLRLYAFITLVFFALAWIAVVVRAVAMDREVNVIISDGRYYYVYLPSLVVDGDLDFSNQIREHWETEWNPALLLDRTERGLVRNQYPIGLALTLFPSFLAAHAATKASALGGGAPLAPDGYSLLYQLAATATVMALGLASMAMIDSLVVRRFHVNPRAAAAAIVAYWIGTPFAYYFFREPLMVHVVSAFWVASILSVGLAMTDGVRWWHPLVLTLAISMALVCRPSNVFIAPFLVYVAVELHRRRLLAGVIRFLPLAILGLVPLFLQLLTWRLLSGHWVNYGYRVSFHWSEPMFLQTLVSPRHGLFVWSPLLVLAAGGAAWATFRRGYIRDGLWLSLLLSGAILWYVNSAWEIWWFGDAFGARAFLELSFLFILGLALCFDHVRTSAPIIHVLVMTWTLASIVYSTTLMALYIAEEISREGPLF
jgi:hypothetical protein